MSLHSIRSERRLPLALLGLAAVALALRIYRLGERVFYYDEAWFGYWVLRYIENGSWTYRPILHGPFFARVNSVVFPVLGASDFTARLVVAVIGGLLPLSAWLFREHLRDGEVVALAAALACNPILVYYSRFMRKDLPLAAFMFVTLGLLVRASDTGRSRYLYAGAVTLGLAFTTKESVLLWVLTWAGAGVLVLDRRLLLASDGAGDAATRLRAFANRGLAGLRRWTERILWSVLLFLGVVVYFYAPRAGPDRSIGLWRALTGEFRTLPAVVSAATSGALQRAIDYWAQGDKQDHAYLPYFMDSAETIVAGALAVTLLAVVGFFYDRYGGERPRDLVAFNFYCGLAALVGYPLANNFPVPWSTVHAVVPLTVPAAVGGYTVYRWGRSRLPAREPRALREHAPMHAVRAGVAAVVLVALTATAGTTLVATSYEQPHESPKGDPGSEVVYYAQAPAPVQGVVTDIERAAASGGDDIDVLYVGERLAMNESAVATPPATGAWHARMPLPWYTEALGADVESTSNVSGIGAGPPPVVITTPEREGDVAAALGDEYRSSTVPLDDVGDRIVVVFTTRD